MDRFLFSHLDQAFELSYFIHRDKKLALRITIDAGTRVEVLAAAHDKRRYYRPRSHRRRVSMTRSQIFQRLLLSTSEPHERRQEAADEGLSQDLLVVRYVAYLVRICIKRNAFHVALGLGRLLHAYTTGETMKLYDLVLQDPERYREPDYFRARKKCLFGELRRRFGPLLETCRGQRGERLFAPRQPDRRLAELVRRSLVLLTPWETRCEVPERFRPGEHELEALRFRGSHVDDEHPIEMNRIHALLHPDCLRRLVRALGLASPARRLAVPLFCLAAATGGDGGPPEPDDEPDDDEPDDDELDDADRRAVVDELERREDLRRRVEAGVFRVLVDGVEAARWDVERNRRLCLALGEEAELVEVVTREQGEDVLLAAHLLPHLAAGGGAAGGEAPGQRPPEARVRLAGGGRLDFTVTVTPVEAGPIGVTVEIRYRETRPRRAVLHLRRRLGETLRIPVPRLAWQSAAASALLVLAVAGAGLLLEWPKGSLGSPRIRGAGVVAVELAEVERVYVDPLGEDPFAQALRARLEELLAAHDHLAHAAGRGEADAVLMSRPGGSPPGGRLAVRLVNARGEVLWQGMFRGSAEQMAAESVAELHAAIRRAGGH